MFRIVTKHQPPEKFLSIATALVPDKSQLNAKAQQMIQRLKKIKPIGGVVESALKEKKNQNFEIKLNHFQLLFV